MASFVANVIVGNVYILDTVRAAFKGDVVLDAANVDGLNTVGHVADRTGHIAVVVAGLGYDGAIGEVRHVGEGGEGRAYSVGRAKQLVDEVPVGRAARLLGVWTDGGR